VVNHFQTQEPKVSLHLVLLLLSTYNGPQGDAKIVAMLINYDKLEAAASNTQAT
jgi:hypothetical protein